MINFATLQALDIPEGKVTQITDASGRVIWAVGGGKVILEVEKITSNTYAGETTYENEQFILLNIYPKTNGTVSVTYGGLTKTITDTSGAEEPNAQQVFFGTFNGVSDNVATPASGELTIEGDCYAFGLATFQKAKSNLGGNPTCACVTKVRDWGSIEVIHDYAFLKMISEGPALSGELVLSNKIKHIGQGAFQGTDISGDLVIPSSVESIGALAFSTCGYLTTVTIKGASFIGYHAFYRSTSSNNVTSGLQKVVMLLTEPPTLEIFVPSEGDPCYTTFGVVGSDTALPPEQIIVPKGCGNIYKNAEGWSTYADLIVEAS